MPRHLCITLLLGCALVACGDDDASEPTAAKKPAAAKPAAAKAALPAELVGSWTMKLPVAEIPDAPNELNMATPEWKLNISADGGVDGAPSFTLANASDEVGAIFSPAVTASSDRMKLVKPDEACSLEFGYAVDGDELALQAPDMRVCADPVIDTILTANPWKREG